MTNFDNENDYERLNRILNRLPNKGEFIDDLEIYVDELNEPLVDEKRSIKYFSFVLSIFAIIIVVFFRFYPTLQEIRPVSLNKLIKLHEQNKVTKKILTKHMYAKPYGEAIKLILEMADKGNVHAQNITCWVYSEGINVPVNHSLSAEYCYKAAGQNHPGAQMNLGIHYAEYAKPKDIAKAIHFYTLAAEHREDAAWYLSNIYAKYPEPIKDFEKAIKYKTRAANMGNTYAMMSIAQDYEHGRLGVLSDHALALKYYEMATDAGHVDAHTFLSEFYRDAEPEFQDYDKMVSHAQKGIFYNRHPSAYAIMGNAYLEGQGVEKSERKAARYFSKAAKRGDTFSIHKLAFLKSDSVDSKDTGFGYRDVILPYVVKNAIHYDEHFHYLYDIVDGDSLNPLVKTRIFEYYADGFLGKHDDGYVPLDRLSEIFSGQGYSSYLRPVVQAYETAASYTSGEHAYELARIYMSGSGVERNPTISLNWISKAMDAGFHDRDHYIGLYLQQPDNPIERETQASRDLLQRAAMLGSEVAAETLGVFYEQGVGITADKALAMYWFNHADKGRSDKGEIILSLRKNMDSKEISRAEYLIKNCEMSELNACMQKL